MATPMKHVHRAPLAGVDQCQACGGTALDVFYTARNVPVHSCLMLPTREKAIAFPTGDIELAFCKDCGFIGNTKFDVAMNRYSADYEETQGFSPRFRKFLGELCDEQIKEHGLAAGMSLLEIGCGTGRNLIAAAQAYPKAELYGFDISEEMLKTAKAAISRAGLADRIHLVQGDATAFDAAAAFGREAFDRVYFSYTLSMIPPWRVALARGLTLTRSGGRFSVVDFGFCEGLGRLPRAILHGWLKLFHVTPRAELEDELKALARNGGRQCRFERPFRGYAQLGTVG